VVILYTTRFNSKEFYALPTEGAYVFYVSEQAAIIFLYSVTDWLS